jgi:hypothetical protein
MKVGKKEKKRKNHLYIFWLLDGTYCKNVEILFYFYFILKKFGNSRNSFACIKTIFFRAKK